MILYTSIPMRGDGTVVVEREGAQHVFRANAYGVAECDLPEDAAAWLLASRPEHFFRGDEAAGDPPADGEQPPADPPVVTAPVVTAPADETPPPATKHGGKGRR
jgi:hypothetical protein